MSNLEHFPNTPKRRPRDFYTMMKPNTALWLARILTTAPLLFVLFSICLRVLGFSNADFLNPDTSNGNLIFYFVFTLSIMMSLNLKGSLMQATDKTYMDEFELQLLSRAYVFSFRIIAISLIIPFIYLTKDSPLARAISAPNIDIATISIYIIILMVITLSPAYYHWKLKPVGPEDNIRQDPPFIKPHLQ